MLKLLTHVIECASDFHSNGEVPSQWYTFLHCNCLCSSTLFLWITCGSATHCVFTFKEHLIFDCTWLACLLALLSTLIVENWPCYTAILYIKSFLCFPNVFTFATFWTNKMHPHKTRINEEKRIFKMLIKDAPDFWLINEI